MKRLILYSDQVPGKSGNVDMALIEMLNKDNPRIAYIPSHSDLTRKYFSQKKAYYGSLGIHDLVYFDIDLEYDAAMTDRLLACDGIHLSGGDTAYFLRSIKRRGFQEVLRHYVHNGGVLIGISAGSILISKSIDLAGLLQDNEAEPCCTDSLNLVDFEFVPHWERNHLYLDKLKQYSEQQDTVIYACSDSDGIVVDGEKTTFIGKVLEIRNGNANYL